MNLRQLEALHHVMMTGSVSEAAKEMYRTQPAVTALIKGLETSVGLALFERRGRGLVPLPEARYLHEETKEILRRLQRLRETMDSFQKAEKGTLRIAGALAPSSYVIPSLINDDIQGTEQVSISHVAAGSVEVHHLVSSHQVDIGFVDMGTPNLPIDTTLINYRPVEMNAVVAVAADDPLHRLDVVTPNDLSGRPLVILPEEHKVALSIEKAFRDADATFNPRLEAQASFSSFIPIRDGAAVGLVDPMTARGFVEWARGDACMAVKSFEPSITYKFAVVTPVFLPESQITQNFGKRLLTKVEECKSYFAEA